MNGWAGSKSVANKYVAVCVQAAIFQNSMPMNSAKHTKIFDLALRYNNNSAVFTVTQTTLFKVNEYQLWSVYWLFCSCFLGISVALVTQQVQWENSQCKFTEIYYTH